MATKIHSFTSPLDPTLGGSGRDSATAYAVICGGTTSTGAQQSIVSVGTSGQVLTSNGAGALPTFQTPSAGVVQEVNTQTGAVATGSTIMPFDDTIPQNTEGDEYMTLSITPTNANNKLTITAVWNGTCAAGAYMGIALFQDSTANALAAGTFSVSQNAYPAQGIIRYKMTAGTTSATTFKIRVGGNNGSTVTFNGQASGRIFGGAIVSSITITETTY